MDARSAQLGKRKGGREEGREEREGGREGGREGEAPTYLLVLALFVLHHHVA